MNSKQSERISEAKIKLWDFFIQLGIKGAQDLRKELKISESEFIKTAPYAHLDPSNCFFYRVLDETQKASLNISQWKDYISEGFDSSKTKDEEGQQIDRLSIECVLDDQQFRIRKLIEVLVETILFSTTNNPKYYRDYFFIHQLNENARFQNDSQEFFGFLRQDSIQHSKWIYEEIHRLEKNGLNPADRWYLEAPIPIHEDWIKKGARLSSFQKKYKAALPISNPRDLIVLGRSYSYAYGMSKDIHFTALDTSSDFKEIEILDGITKVGLLIFSIIGWCQKLIDIIPEGINKVVSKMYSENSYPNELIDQDKSSPAEIGDTVLANGAKAEVINILKSKYGYSAFHIKYLNNEPIHRVPDDWFSGFEIKLIEKNRRKKSRQI